MESLDVLVSRLPEGAVATAPRIMRERAIDSWALALLRQVRGDDLPLPAAVVLPASTEDVATVLAWASESKTAVIPRGTGSGVCGGAQAQKGSVVLDLSRMNKVTGLDLVSQTVDVQAGVRGDQLEDALAAEHLTVGHYPQSAAISTVGGWIAASSAGQASAGFGAIEDVLLGLTAVLPNTEILRCEGTLAVVTEATLACQARPTGWQWLAFGFGSFNALADGLREVVRTQTGAAVIRGYDETDAALSFGTLGHPGGCVALLGFPADLVGLQVRTKLANTVLHQAAATDLDASYGEHWLAHRNDAVGLYRQIMGPDRAFGPGVIVDTVEVAGLWSAVPALHAGVRDALAAHAEAVGCHLSHLYSSGSSLYFTFLIRGADDRDVEARYLAAWRQAMASCAAAGGTITHHHGVGRLKAPFLAAELGPAGTDVLKRIKAALDPDGVLNPGVLLP